MLQKGTFTEELVNVTIDWYLDNDVAFFRKAHIPISINKKESVYTCRVSLLQKADVDYYGVFDGRYFGFEVKETEKDFFLLSNVKEHQRRILLKIREFGAVSFLLLNFVSYPDSVFILTSETLAGLFESRKRIKIEDAREMGIPVPVSFPGVLDWLKALGFKD